MKRLICAAIAVLASIWPASAWDIRIHDAPSDLDIYEVAPSASLSCKDHGKHLAFTAIGLHYLKIECV